MCALGGLAGTGCSSTSTTRLAFTDEGQLCLYPAGEENGVPGFDTTPRTYLAGELVNVAVRFPTCLSSSCSTERMAGCAVSGAGGALHVSSNGSYLSHEGTCTTDCGFLIARCQTSALAAGTTTFEHGGAVLTLTVPFTGAPPCAGQPGL